MSEHPLPDRLVNRQVSLHAREQLFDLHQLSVAAPLTTPALRSPARV